MEVVNTLKCVKCKRTKAIDNYKCCISCREYLKEYHLNNRERRNEQRKLNHQNNKEHDKMYWIEYQKNHKEQIKERKKQYREDNKDKLKEAQQEYMKKMYNCPLCNYEIKFYKKSQHEKSQIHQNHLKQKLEENE